MLSRLRRFTETTSLKGVSRTVKTEPRRLRLIWICALIIFFAFGILQMALLLREYFSFAVIPRSKMEFINYENPQVFPRITLCNLRPLQSGSEPDDLRRKFQSIREEATSCNQTCSEYDQKILNILKQQLNGVLGMRQFYDMEFMERIGHQEVPFIISCSKTYRNGMTSLFLPCNGTVKFTREKHPQLLNCYSTITPMFSDADLDVGPADGLSFILFLDNFSFMNNSQNFTAHEDMRTVGVKLELSSQTDIPLVGTEPIFLKSGTESVVSFSVYEYRALPEPYGPCVHYTETQPSDRFGIFCRAKCITEHILFTCGCVDITQGILFKANETHPFCGNLTLSKEELMSFYRCVVRYRDESIDSLCEEQCGVVCNTFSFKVKSSSSEWPYSEEIESFWDYIIQIPEIAAKLEPHFKAMSESTQDPVRLFDIKSYIIKSNFQKVTVRMAGYEQMTMEETRKTSLVTVLSKVAAALNFWSGITVILFVEIFEIFYRFCDEKTKSKTKQVDVEEC